MAWTFSWTFFGGAFRACGIGPRGLLWAASLLAGGRFACGLGAGGLLAWACFDEGFRAWGLLAGGRCA
ncbi:hypothetical protein AUC70_03425 [Methyloceanibacter stevinii]|uniref:Uncharacterized protein n=1 Tax=Methyloceanibacter stevinii TaxID=1774970 RepID=A0A1E3VQW6_9HYPH|nr:hypothetical protein AUC70_03425 [Methyloceanibacter stevinii]